MTKHICIKVQNLRSLGYENLREWLKDDKNIYVGRRGRIFIKETDGTKTVFHYKQSKFANPYKNKDDLTSCLELYEQYVFDTGLINDIHELKGYNLGCFCPQNSPCHAKVLCKLLDSQSNH